MELKVESRKDKSLEEFRKLGKIPAVFYGKKEESTPIVVNYLDFIKLYREVGNSTIFELDLDGDKKDVLVKDTQKDPVSEKILHIDFYAIERGVEIEIDVVILYEGEPTVKGGVVSRILHDIKVKTLPRHIPSEIIVDLTKLENIGDSIAIKDLDVLEGVTFLHEEDETIASVSEQVEEQEELDDTADSPDMDAIQVEKKGKGEESESDNKE